MLEPPVLHTDRLLLEPLSLRHSRGMFLMWSREEVCRYSGPASDLNGDPIPLPAESAADSDRIIEFFEHMAAVGGGFRWALVTRQEREFAGAVGFNRLRPSAELAFHLRPEFWGQGLMREAAEAALDWVRRRSDAPVEAFIEPLNTASAALARRLGFAPTGALRDGTEQFLLTPYPSCDGRVTARAARREL
jgi:ribosomal-protein-alanine N-acetyltransferase